ncbi:MAG TPA: hypothetical protein VNV37_00955, partial [Solirubrobacteraceae bacterium]|nr:hypothetical protein [Solirubrobacteraceae bacterium]
VAEGESRQTASEEVAQELGDEVEGSIDEEVSTIDPGSEDAAGFEADSTDAANAVSDGADATLPDDAATGIDGTEVAAGDAGDLAIDDGAEAVAGDDLIDVLAVFLLADHHRPPPPGLVATNGQLLPQQLLGARPLGRLAPHALRRAGFPGGAIPALVRARLALPVPAQVRPLAVSSTRLQPRRRIAILAPRLGAGHVRDALIVLQGPGYRATRLVRIAHGAAGTTIVLPRRLAAGTWTISVQTLGHVTLAPNHQLAGFATVRLGVFTVAKPGRRHRGGRGRRRGR